MTNRASAAAALTLAAGLFVVFAAPAAAAGSDNAASRSESATSGKSAKQGSPALKTKRFASRKSNHEASKPVEPKKAVSEGVADAGGNAPIAMPESVANANAQMIPAAATSNSARTMSEAMSAKANTILLASADKPVDGQAPAEAAVIASDQLNDVDRALQQPAAPRTVAMASVSPAQEAPAVASNNDSSTLDKTSLIGKIFIGFGALLTMASAARMFMA